MKKKEIAILCSLLAVVLLLGGVFVFALRFYLGKGLSELVRLEGEYSYNGKLLLSEEKESALLYEPFNREIFREIKLEQVDLSPFGFDGRIFSYYKVELEKDYGIVLTNFYPVESSYEPFWPVCGPERFVYIAEDGKKYNIHPKENLCYPMFADSIEGVDPFGQNVVAFSANSDYAISLDGTDVTVYRTDPSSNSLRVVSVQTVSFAEYGSNLRFGAFVGNSQAYFSVSGKEGEYYVALDCNGGKTAKTALDLKGSYGPALNRLYAQRLDIENEGDKDLILHWNHLLLGSVFSGPELKGFSQGEIFSVSPRGGYAVARVQGEGKEEVLVMSEKRAFSVTSVLPENETVQKVDFIYENIMAVSLLNREGEASVRVFKICF